MSGAVSGAGGGPAPGAGAGSPGRPRLRVRPGCSAQGPRGGLAAAAGEPLCSSEHKQNAGKVSSEKNMNRSH